MRHRGRFLAALRAPKPVRDEAFREKTTDPEKLRVRAALAAMNAFVPRVWCEPADIEAIFRDASRIPAEGRGAKKAKA